MFADVTNDMIIARQENFRPVLVAIPFDDDAEPIAMANDSSFGLGSAIWTRDVARAQRVAGFFIIETSPAGTPGFDRNRRHRLSSGWDRQANRALHMIACTRLPTCLRTRAYRDRRA